MYAVVRTGGKQYRVEAGRAVRVDHLPGEPGDSIELGDVLLMGDGDDVTIGAPTIDGARVVGTIAEQGRAPKIVVFRYKSKTRSRKKTGHRQQFTKILVEDILGAGEEPKPKPAAPALEEEAPVAAPKKRTRRKAAAVEAAAEAEASAPDRAAADAGSSEQPVPKPKRSRRKTE